MSASRKLSALLGILLLISSIIAIIVVISQTNLKNPTHHHHNPPSNQNEYHPNRPSTVPPAATKINQTVPTPRRQKHINKTIHEIQAHTQQDIHHPQEQSEQIIQISKPIQGGVKLLELNPIPPDHHREDQVPNIEQHYSLPSKPFPKESPKKSRDEYSGMNMNKVSPPSRGPIPENSVTQSPQPSSLSPSQAFRPDSPRKPSHSSYLHQQDDEESIKSIKWMPPGMSPESSEGSSLYEAGPDASSSSFQHYLHQDHYNSMDASGDDADPDDTQPEGFLGSSSSRIQFAQIFDLASSLYASGTNASGLQEFLRIINETASQASPSELLSHLNDFYPLPQNLTSVSSSGIIGGRNGFETSLSAFVFMSFGVFLLNQIHKIMGNPGESLTSQGRTMPGGHELDDESQPFHSGLDILFTPPQNETTSSYPPSSSDNLRGQKGADAGAEGRKLTHHHTLPSSTPQITSPRVNDMFRGVLNLLNAYTKDSQVLECIWSLYCHDLDNTASKQGLYGLAARINSIGLRLIMDQIPAELTLDVLLRSLFGWDGLPCNRMFPKCLPKDATAALIELSSATPQPPLGNHANHLT